MADASDNLVFEGPVNEIPVYDYDTGQLAYTILSQENLILHWEQLYDSATNTSSLTITGYLQGVRAEYMTFDGTAHWIDGVLTVNGVDIAAFNAGTGTQYALIGGPESPAPIRNAGSSDIWSVTVTGLQHNSQGKCPVTIGIKRNAASSYGGTGFCNKLGQYYYTYNFGTMSGSIVLEGTVQPTEQGVIFLDTGTGFQPYTVWIDTGTTWVQAVPYLDTGSDWILCGREAGE